MPVYSPKNIKRKFFRKFNSNKKRFRKRSSKVSKNTGGGWWGSRLFGKNQNRSRFF
jgi:hypothetical protein